MTVTEQTALNGHVREAEIDVKNPVTGAVIGSIPVQDAAQVRAAVARARNAQRYWGAVPVTERVAILREWGARMWAEQQMLIRTIRDETGKPDASALAEVVLTDAYNVYYTGNAPRILATETRPTMIPLVQTGRVHHVPHGVVGVISPWNYPLMLPLWDVLAALIAGNAVVVKPSELTPFSTMRAVALLHEAGVPQPVVQVVTGAGETGAALVDTADYISFTGSTATGRKIGKAAAERLIPFTLELGGKDPMLVLRDVQINLAAHEAIKGAFESAGQACTSVERVYVEDPVYDAFVTRVAELAPKLAISAGDGLDVHIGSMTNKTEFARTQVHIADAVAKGARIVYGGNPRPDLGPLFHEPTILADCTHDMEIMREETFGPVLPIMRVRDALEAVALANDSDYGLTASIFSRDLARANRLAAQIETGVVSINRIFAFFPSAALPWGGSGQSGVGRRAGPEGLLRFTKTQSVVTDTQIGLLPSLNVADPITLGFAKVMRRVRRVLPRV